ncbi:hypothetical protein MNB_SV-6-240 [hydrothermal vent metagenome]|uniref:Carboxypeptidase regulatory-like domain-containing protein n=1 Tax=hydrothermal vent metagenome TaxID=652676 RepID=A0A1W1CDZ4_9ZZZZ
MLKNIFMVTMISALISLFTGCVGQPKVNEHQSQSDSAVLWDENKNIDADENDNVDVSDLDKEVTTGDGTIAGETIARIPFPVEEYSRLERSGKGTIQGTIYLQDAYGTKIVGAKRRLYLNPVTSYSRQWYEKSYIGGNKMGKADSRLFNYLRFTSSDENGAFAFYGVPSGRYYLIGTVNCAAKCGYGENRNIRIATEVFINGNQVIEQDLSKGI